MGSFSIWHWVILIIGIIGFGLPWFFLLRSAPNGPNRFGPPSTPASFTEAISRFFKNYTDFSGRATRSEFWFAKLTVAVASIAFSIVDIIIFNKDTGVFLPLFSFGVIIPSIALSCRRLHDLNRSGWHQLLHYMFPIGTVGLFVWYCRAGTDTAKNLRDDMTGLKRQDGFTSDDPESTREAHSVITKTLNPLNRDSIEVLERLAKLKDNGAITADEYETQKRRLL